MTRSVEVRYRHTRSTPVTLEGKLVGHIHKVIGGYQYFPKGRKRGGEVYPSFDEVTRSLGPDPLSDDLETPVKQV